MIKIQTIPRVLRGSKRFQEIVSTFAKYGLAGWLKNVNVDWLQKHFQSPDGDRISDLPQGAKLRLALTELGTTFIKLGQILSTRPDLVGPEVMQELAMLQSGTPADSEEVVRGIIEDELGASVEELFAEFNGVAAASASIGQVHFATLHDGTQVVVKVQHADIEKTIRSDLDIMHAIAQLAETYSEDARRFKPVDTLEEFSRALLTELDFTQERRSLDRFADNFAGDDNVFIPAAYADQSSRRVLTMGKLDGISLSNAEKLTEQGYDLSLLAERGANIFLEMIFRDGFYHADPHPGNIFALPGSTIGLLDFGMVGRIDEKLREQFEDLMIAASDQDSLGLCDSICALGSAPKDLDTDQLRVEMGEYVAIYGGQSLDEFDVGGSLNRMMEIVRRFNILLPSRVSMLIKVLVMLEGTARELNPQFNLAQILEPHKKMIVKRRLSPVRLMKKARRNAADWTRLAEMAPRELADILNQIKRGRFDVHLEHRKLDVLINRMITGILTAALFMGSASILSNKVRPTFHEVSIFGLSGCVVAVLMGFHLVRAIRRSRD